jgi:catechol 2,3-dioxygenase-like lactoylglutathione lyase family enzyme
MSLQVTTIMLGVADVDRAKRFYVDLGGEVEQDYPGFAKLSLGAGSSSIALYEREAAAADAGVPAEGSGFRGVSFHFIVDDAKQVDAVMERALAAGATTVKAAADVQWGYFGYFADPDGYLWKVASG